VLLNYMLCSLKYFNFVLDFKGFMLKKYRVNADLPDLIHRNKKLSFIKRN
jgi:hypothetical protein